MQLEISVLSEISQIQTDTWSFSYADFRFKITHAYIMYVYCVRFHICM